MCCFFHCLLWWLIFYGLACFFDCLFRGAFWLINFLSSFFARSLWVHRLLLLLHWLSLLFFPIFLSLRLFMSLIGCLRFLRDFLCSGLVLCYQLVLLFTQVFDWLLLLAFLCYLLFLHFLDFGLCGFDGFFRNDLIFFFLIVLNLDFNFIVLLYGRGNLFCHFIWMNHIRPIGFHEGAFFFELTQK